MKNNAVLHYNILLLYYYIFLWSSDIIRGPQKSNDTKMYTVQYEATCKPRQTSTPTKVAIPRLRISITPLICIRIKWNTMKHFRAILAIRTSIRISASVNIVPKEIDDIPIQFKRPGYRNIFTGIISTLLANCFCHSIKNYLHY